ncbi:MAG: metallophosphoesterase family protein [Chloroflexota bacterium]
MKLAVLADIHGNLAALTAVVADIAAWRPDAVVVAGDIVNRGPCSRACLERVLALARDAGWRLLRGNHEDYVLNVARHPELHPPGLEDAVRENVRWTWRQLGAATEALEQLPERVSLPAPDGSEVRVVHASMRHNRDNILADTPDEVLRQQIAPAPALFVVGHTHRPLIRRIDQTLVVNVGSVGLPFDGDVRAAYGRMEWRDGGWEAEIVRLPYDRAQTERDFAESGFLDASGPIAPLIYDEFLTARPRLFTFVERYREPVLAGAMTPEQAASEFLATLRSDGAAA